MFKCFYILCSITGQYTIIPSSCKDIKKIVIVVWSLITTVIFSFVNLSSLIFDIYIIVKCPYKYCGYISVMQKAQMLSQTDAQKISNISDHDVVRAVNLTIFSDWQKIVMTTATPSGTISYLFMIYVLYSQYNSFVRKTLLKFKKWLRKCWLSCGEKLKPEIVGALQSPFVDSNGNTATKLSPRQWSYFMAIFSLNLLIYIGNVSLLFTILPEV